VLARQDEVEIIGAGQAVTKVIDSSEGRCGSVLTCLNSIMLFSGYSFIKAGAHRFSGAMHSYPNIVL